MTYKDYDAIVFDFGGVLIDLDIEKSYDALGLLVGSDPMEIEAIAAQIVAWSDELETGAIRGETFLWRIQNLTQNELNPIDIRDAWNAMLLGWQQSKLDFLASISAKLPTYLLSNTNEIHLDWVRRDLIKNHNITDFDGLYFKKTYYSHQIGHRKPDEGVYEFVIKDSGLDPAKTLFVDDNYTNVLAAAKAGFQVMHHPSNDSLDFLLGED